MDSARRANILILSWAIGNLYTFFAAPCPDRGFFFFPSWWKYLDGANDPLGKCTPVVNFPDGIWLIGLAVLDILLRLAGFIAVISIMVAGIELVISQGNSEKGTAARQRLIKLSHRIDYRSSCRYRGWICGQ